MRGLLFSRLARASVALLILATVAGEAFGRRPPAPQTRPAPLARRQLPTKHEGMVWYRRYGNDWGRERGEITPGDAYFFQAYDSTNADISRLLRDAGYTGRRPKDEKQLWEQIGRVWAFLSRNVRHANSGELSPQDRWPSLAEYAAFYASHDELAWWACFSKAHVFASILGRIVDRDRVVIASAHHTENGAPPTATHVYVAVYVAREWYYLDPTAVHTCAFPEFAQRRSIGVPSMTTVDYRHPYKILVLPGSTLSHVPYLAGGSRAVRPTDSRNATRLRPADQAGSRRVIVPREGSASRRRPSEQLPAGGAWKAWDAKYLHTMRRVSLLKRNPRSRAEALRLERDLQRMRTIVLDAQRLANTRSGQSQAPQPSLIVWQSLVGRIETAGRPRGRDVDEEALERMRDAKQEAIAQQTSDETNEAASAARELWRQAMRLIRETAERQTQTTRTFSQ